MGLIHCNECGKEISDKARTCPNCGNPQASSMVQIVSGKFGDFLDIGMRKQYFSRIEDNFVIISKVFLVLVILSYLILPFYKLSNRSETLHKASIIKILSDYHPKMDKGRMRTVVLELKKEIQLAHTTFNYSLRDGGLLNLQFNPFLANILNLLMAIAIIFLRLPRPFLYRAIFTLSLMIFFTSLAVKILGTVYNTILTNKSYQFYVTFPAQNALVYLAIAMIILSGLLIFIPVYINGEEIKVYKRLHKWASRNRKLNLAIIILFISFLLLGNLAYYIAFPYLIFIVVIGIRNRSIQGEFPEPMTVAKPADLEH